MSNVESDIGMLKAIESLMPYPTYQLWLSLLTRKQPQQLYNKLVLFNAECIHNCTYI